MEHFDTDRFIAEINNRPATWNSLLPEYSNKVLKRNAWDELCQIFYNDFNEKTNKEKNLAGRRHRSRSPHRKGDKFSEENQDGSMSMNPMMMNMNDMYQQGNMMMPYSNMMMPMMGGMMQPGNVDMQHNGPGMEMMQSPMEMSGMPPVPHMNNMPGVGAAPMNNMAMNNMPMNNMAMNNMPMNNMPMGNMNNMPMMGGMMVDPSVMNMGNMGMYQSMGRPDMPPVQDRKEIKLKYVHLIPPNPSVPTPPRRERPPGCKTIFVGGLPEKIRESTVREIFERYGKILTLRLSRKNFCHIRFDSENSVEQSFELSGYTIKLLEKKEDGKEEDNNSNIGCLHVDYAFSRDDKSDYERRQRQLMRIQQTHMEELSSQEMEPRPVERNHYRRRSPSPILKLMPFNNTTALQLAEKIKNEEHFSVALPTLLSWLERGECSKKNANNFYSMIQATNSHVRRLVNEKMQAEDELVECKERIKNNIAKIIDQLEQVAKVFNAAGHKRVWDHFTKPQRKNIETWQKMAQEFNTFVEDFNEKFGNEDMDIGNGSGDRKNNANSEEIQQLKIENDSLRFQLEAYKNEVSVIKMDAEKEMERFKAQYTARQNLLDNHQQPPLPPPMTKPPPPPPLSKPPPPPPPFLEIMDVKKKEPVDVEAGEAKLIGVMSAFLQVHPQGASLDYVVSYVKALFPNVLHTTVHNVLQKHGDVFQCKVNGVGANIENRWYFSAYSS